MATHRKRKNDSGIPPGADPGVSPEVFAQLMADPPTREQEEQWLENLERSRRDEVYLDSIRERVLAEHGDCWIAAHEEEVVGIADTWQGLHDLLDARGLTKGKAVRRHFQSHPPSMVPGLRRWL